MHRKIKCIHAYLKRRGFSSRVMIYNYKWTDELLLELCCHANFTVRGNIAIFRRLEEERIKKNTQFLNVWMQEKRSLNSMKELYVDFYTANWIFNLVIQNI